MSKDNGAESSSIDKAMRKIGELEERISRLEKQASAPAESKKVQKEGMIEISFGRKEAEDTDGQKETRQSSSELESKVGEYGMAWIGNIVLFSGIVFLLQLFSGQGKDTLSAILGLSAVSGIFLLSRSLHKQHGYMAKLFNYNGHILLFIVVLRLHYFTKTPVLSSQLLGLLVLFAVLGVMAYRAYIKRSQLLMGLVMIMIFITALASNSTHVLLPLLVIITAMSLLFLQKFGWRSIQIMAIFVVYTGFLLWFFNNPFITHEMKMVSSLQYSYIYLTVTALLFSSIALLPLGDKVDESQVNSSIIINGLGFTLIMALINVNFLRDNYYITLGVISAVSIAFSAILQSKGVLKLSASLYGLYGFAILSVAIGGIFKFPLAYLLLSIESLLVVSMALWFRSRFIVSMNMFMYIGLLTAYVLSGSYLYSIEISFALVALGTARVLNWKRDRLEIKTDLLRNVYLVIGFIMTLISLYHAAPSNYITFSWAMAAGLFFVLSLLLRNVKYRWLAITAMVSAVGYFFLFDLKHIELGYRVLAMMVIAVISLSFSIFYARKIRSKEEEDSE